MKNINDLTNELKHTENGNIKKLSSDIHEEPIIRREYKYNYIQTLNDFVNLRRIKDL
jgi:hypothetical protein